jgi:phage/plasmid-like protein (TIGR03299 family)
MAHEINKNDGLVLANEGAWHGLGTVVKGAVNPYAALRLAGLEWEVQQSDSITGVFNAGEQDEYRIGTDTAKVLVRSDDKSVLGVVGPDYTPFQNQTLADLAYALAAGDAGVEVESAGSIRSGKRVWMLLKAPSVEFGCKGDETVPYFLLANSHDGTLALKGLPTGVRVVCSNTYHMALGARRAALSFRHTLNLNNRVDEIARCIKSWHNTIDKGAEVARNLAARSVSREQVQALWVDVIQTLDGAEIPSKPQNGWEERRRERAIAGLARASQVFDRESQQFGANLWVAANAITNWIQHDRAEDSVRTKDGQVRAYAAWDGSVADDVATALDAAVALL